MWQSFVSTWLELAPWLLLGALVSSLLHVALPTDFVRGQLAGKLGVLKAVALGVPLPLCSCGVIPAGIGLKKQGASDGAAVGFLISTPQTGADSILVSASFLGWPFALFKVVTALVTGVAGGLWAGSGDAPAPDEPVVKMGPHRSWAHFRGHFVEVLQPIWRWILFGVAASVAIEHLVPSSVFVALARGGPLVAMLAVLALSLPMYVCATASVPIAAALIASGMPAGAGMVFLIAGPATNVATVGAIFRTLGKRALGIYLATIVAGSLVGGMLFDGLIDAESVRSVHHHGAPGAVTLLSGIVLAALIAWFAAQDLRAWIARRRPVAKEVLRVPVSGMTCNGCARRLESALLADAGVESATVQLEPGEATIVGISSTRACELITAAGYTPGTPH